jgi:hypothetical protein
MTILSIPLLGAEDGLGARVGDNAQLYIEPRFAVFDEDPVSILPDGFLSGNRIIRVVRLPRTLRTIGHNVFSRMESLEELDLSATAVETIGERFLLGTVSVKICRFPSTLRSLGYFCLHRTSIKRVDLSGTLVGSLPAGFLSFTPVDVLLVPPSLECIRRDALRMTGLRRLDCSHTRLRDVWHGVLNQSPLVELLLPSTLELIAFSALQDTQLRVVRVGEAEIPWINEHRFDPMVDELRVPSFICGLDPGSLNGTSLRRLDLSLAKIYNIEGRVLCNNPCLEEVLLPMTVSTVGVSFLNRAPKLRSLDLRCTKLHTVGDDFLFGTPIEEIWFPDSLRSVGKRFLFGARITCLDLSKTLLTSVGADFLQKCDRLQTLLLPEWLIDIPENLPFAGRMAEAIVLPRCIEVLGAPSFQHAPFLRLMDLSQTVVKFLPHGTLSAAPNLIDVRLPRSLEYIFNDVFLRTSLRTVNLRHTNLRFIGDRFCAFSPLRRLYVPEDFPPQVVASFVRPGSADFENENAESVRI